MRKCYSIIHSTSCGTAFDYVANVAEKKCS